jgi:hypothetical protein
MNGNRGSSKSDSKRWSVRVRLNQQKMQNGNTDLPRSRQLTANFSRLTCRKNLGIRTMS